MGKGSKRRVRQIDIDEFDSNWDLIFRRDSRNKVHMKPERRDKGEDGEARKPKH
jgi:hypothetical protein